MSKVEHAECLCGKCDLSQILQEIRNEIEEEKVHIQSPIDGRTADRNAQYFNNGLDQALQVIDKQLSNGTRP